MFSVPVLTFFSVRHWYMSPICSLIGEFSLRIFIVGLFFGFLVSASCFLFCFLFINSSFILFSPHHFCWSDTASFYSFLTSLPGITILNPPYLGNTMHFFSVCGYWPFLIVLTKPSSQVNHHGPLTSSPTKVRLILEWFDLWRPWMPPLQLWVLLSYSRIFSSVPLSRFSLKVWSPPTRIPLYSYIMNFRLRWPPQFKSPMSQAARFTARHSVLYAWSSSGLRFLLIQLPVSNWSFE